MTGTQLGGGLCTIEPMTAEVTATVAVNGRGRRNRMVVVVPAVVRSSRRLSTWTLTLRFTLTFVVLLTLLTLVLRTLLVRASALAVVHLRGLPVGSAAAAAARATAAGTAAMPPWRRRHRRHRHHATARPAASAMEPASC